MPSAEIVTIGTEILLGEIQDTNTAYLARQLMNSGIDLFRTHTVGDNPERIAQTIRDSLKRADIIITTGGLGPTVDDPTREAIGLAVNKPLVFHPELWEEITGYYDRIGRIPPENNKRQAYLPEDAESIHNPIGTAPGFAVEVNGSFVISVPGVPKEMEYLTQHFILPFLQKHFQHTMVIKTKIVHVSGMGESQLDMIIGDLEKLSNPTVGLLAKPGQIDIRVAAKAESELIADQMIDGITAQLDKLLGNNIFGFDDEELLDSVIRSLQPESSLSIVESGMKGLLITKLLTHPNNINKTEIVESSLDSQGLRDELLKKSVEWNIKFICGFAYKQVSGVTYLESGILNNSRYVQTERKFAGPPENGLDWAVNIGLDTLRRYLIENN